MTTYNNAPRDDEGNQNDVLFFEERDRRVLEENAERMEEMKEALDTQEPVRRQPKVRRRDSSTGASFDPLRIEDHREVVARYYTPAPSKYSQTDDGRHWKTSSDVNDRSQDLMGLIFGHMEEDNYLKDEDGGFLGSSPYKYKYQMGLLREAMGANFDEAAWKRAQEEGDSAVTNTVQGLIEFFYATVPGFLTGNEEQEAKARETAHRAGRDIASMLPYNSGWNFSHFMSDRAQAAADAGWRAEDTLAEWTKQNPQKAMILGLTDREVQQKYVNLKSPEALFLQLAKDLKMHELNEEWAAFKADSNDLEWGLVNTVGFAVNDMFNIDFVRTLGLGTAAKLVGKGLQGLSKGIGTISKYEPTTLAKAGKKIEGAVDITFSPSAMTRTNYGWLLASEAFVYGSLDNIVRQSNAWRAAEEQGTYFDGFSGTEVLKAGLTTAAGGWLLGHGIHRAVAGSADGVRAAYRVVGDADYATIKRGNQMLTEELEALGVKIGKDEDPSAAASAWLKANEGNEAAGSLQAIMRDVKAAQDRMAIKDAGVKITADSGEILMQRAINRQISRMVGVTDDGKLVDWIGDLGEIEAFGTTSSEVLNVVNALANGRKIKLPDGRVIDAKFFKGQNVSQTAIQGIVQDFLLDSAARAGKDVAEIAVASKNAKGRLFRQLFDDADLSDARTNGMANVGKALDEEIDAGGGDIMQALNKKRADGVVDADSYLARLADNLDSMGKYSEAEAAYAKKASEISAYYAKKRKEVAALGGDGVDEKLARLRKAEADDLLSAEDAFEETLGKSLDDYRGDFIAHITKSNPGADKVTPRDINLVTTVLGVSRAFDSIIRSSSVKFINDEMMARSLKLISALEPNKDMTAYVKSLGLGEEAEKRLLKELAASIKLDNMKPRDIRALLSSDNAEARAELGDLVFGKLTAADNERVSNQTVINSMMKLPVLKQLGTVIDRINSFGTRRHIAFGSSVKEPGLRRALTGLATLIGNDRQTRSMLSGDFIGTLEQAKNRLGSMQAEAFEAAIAVDVRLGEELTNKLDMDIATRLSTEGDSRVYTRADLEELGIDPDMVDMVNAKVDAYARYTEEVQLLRESVGIDAASNKGADIVHMGIRFSDRQLSQAELDEVSTALGRHFHNKARESDTADINGLEALGVVRVDRAGGGRPNKYEILAGNAEQEKFAKALSKTLMNDDEARAMLMASTSDTLLRSKLAKGTVVGEDDLTDVQLLEAFSKMSASDQAAVLRRIKRSDLMGIQNSDGLFYEELLLGDSLTGSYFKSGQRYADGLAGDDIRPNRARKVKDPLEMSGPPSTRSLTQEELANLNDGSGTNLFKSGFLETNIPTMMLGQQSSLFDVLATEKMREMFGVDGLSFEGMVKLLSGEMEDRIKAADMTPRERSKAMAQVEESLDVMLERYDMLAGRFVPTLDNSGMNNAGRIVGNVVTALTGSGYAVGAVFTEGVYTAIRSAGSGRQGVRMFMNALKEGSDTIVGNTDKLDDRALAGLSIGIRRFLMNSPSERLGLTDSQAGRRVAKSMAQAMGRQAKGAVGGRRAAATGLYGDSGDVGLLNAIAAGSDEIASLAVESGGMRVIQEVLHSSHVSIMKRKMHNILFDDYKDGKSRAELLAERLESPENKAKMTELNDAMRRAEEAGDQKAVAKLEKQLVKLYSGEARAVGLDKYNWEDLMLLAEVGLMDSVNVSNLRQAWKNLPADMQVSDFSIPALKRALRDLAGDNDALRVAMSDLTGRMTNIFDVSVARRVTEPAIWDRRSGVFANNEWAGNVMRLTGFSRSFFTNYVKPAANSPFFKGMTKLAMLGMLTQFDVFMRSVWDTGSFPESGEYYLNEFRADPAGSTVGALMQVPLLGVGSGYAAQAFDFWNYMANGMGDAPRGGLSVPAVSVIGSTAAAGVSAYRSIEDEGLFNSKTMDFLHRLNPAQKALWWEIVWNRINPYAEEKREKRNRKLEKKIRRRRKGAFGSAFEQQELDPSPQAPSQPQPEMPTPTPRPEPRRPAEVEDAIETGSTPDLSSLSRGPDKAPDGLFS